MNSLENKERNVLKDYANEPVPLSERRGWFGMALVQIGVCYAATAPLFALEMAKGLSFWNAMLACLIANMILFVLFVVQGSIAAKEGLSTYMLARTSLGRGGAHILAIIIAISCVGWFAINAEYFATGLVSMIPSLGNIHLIAFFGGLLMMTTAVVGYKAIEKLSDIAVPLIILWCVLGAFKAYRIVGTSVFHTIPLGEPYGLMTGIIILVGGMSVGATISPDIFRYGRSSKDIFLANLVYTVAAFFQPFLLMMTINGANTTDLPRIMGFLGPIGILVLILLAWTTNDNNLYSASLAFTEIFPVTKWKVAVTFGFIGSIIAAIGILKYFTSWLSLLSSLAPPFIGIMAGDYYILPKIGLKSGLPLKRNEFINWAGITAWLVGGILTALINTNKIKIYFPGPIIGVAVSLIIYVLLMKLRHINFDESI
ncbi:MAG: cytosine permease [Candidatus Petromonas sp.]|jgi:cytosine permease|nr:cytosine permease [Candidatus Petromonas sp.]MDN5300644.1 cytosine permease [Thermoanaerobacteraceae bacterium]